MTSQFDISGDALETSLMNSVCIRDVEKKTVVTKHSN